VGSYYKAVSKEGTVRRCQSKEASILWSWGNKRVAWRKR